MATHQSHWPKAEDGAHRMKSGQKELPLTLAAGFHGSANAAPPA
jgi:hypothetical protein